MAPVPKKKHTRSRSGKRRRDKNISSPNLSICKNCGAKKLPHVACAKCGNK